MEKYIKLLNKLEKYYKFDELEKRENTISVYELFKLMDNAYIELYNLNNDEKLIQEINMELMKRKIINKFIKKSNSTSSKCSQIKTRFCENKSEIVFYFKDDNTEIIYKDFDSDEIYFDKFNDNHNIDSNLIIKIYDKIMNKFAILEKYNCLLLFESEFNKFYRNPLLLFYALLNSKLYEDSFLNVSIVCDNDKLKPVIKINKDVDKENISEREWVNRKKLSDIIKEKEIDILNNLQINVDELDYVYKHLIDNSRNEEGLKLSRNLKK